MSQVCRTCLEVYENGCQLFSLEINEPMFDRLHIKTKLEACVPEIALHRVRNSVICRYCLFALNTAYDFKTKCLQTETKIYNCMTTETIDSHDLNHIIKRNTNNIFNCDTINQNSQINGESRILLSPLSLLPPPPPPAAPPPPYPPLPPPPPTLSMQTPLSSMQSLSARPTMLSRPSPQVQTDSLFQTRSPYMEGVSQSFRRLPLADRPPPRPADLHQPSGPCLQGGSTSQVGQSLSTSSRVQVEQNLHQVGLPLFSESPRFPFPNSRFQERPPYFQNPRYNHEYPQSSSSIPPGPRYQEGPSFLQSPPLPVGPRFQISSFHQNSYASSPRFQIGPPSYSQNLQLQVRPPFSEASNTRFQVGSQFSHNNSSLPGFRYPPFSQGLQRLQMHHSMRQYQSQTQPTGGSSLFHGTSRFLQGNPTLVESSSQPRIETVNSTAPLQTLFQEKSPQLDVPPQLEGPTLSANQEETKPSLLEQPLLPPPTPQVQPKLPLPETSSTQSPDSSLLTLLTSSANSVLPLSQPLTIPSFSCSFSNTSSPLLSYRLSESGGNTFMLLTPSHKCSICQQCFVSSNLLKEHMNYHINPEGLKCSMCNFQTNSTVCLDEHLKSHGTVVPMDTSTPAVSTATTSTTITESCYKCNNCNYNTVDKNLFKEHRATHVGESIHQCGLCNFRSTHSSSLRRHMKVHMGDRPFRCTECRYGAADEISIQIHMKIHKKERPHKCNDCPFSALKRSKLKIHMLRCHGKVFEPNNQENEDPSSINESLPKTLVDPYQVSLDDIHNILQGEDDSSDQQECSTTPPDLIKEAVDEQEVAQDPYMITVEDIQKILQRKDENDNENNETETGQIDNNVDANNGKVFRCSTCKQQFKYIYLLRRHMVIHSSNNKPLDCPKCDFRTTIKSHLQVHLKTHTGGKVYRCEKCEYSTIYWSNIQKHHRVHTGEKPYKCSICGYKASQQTTLKAHMNTHVENSVLKCTQCSFTADTEDALVTHIEMHSIGGHFLEDGISNNFIEDSIRRHFALNTITKNLAKTVPDGSLVEETSQLSSSCDLNQETVPDHNLIEESSQLSSSCDLNQETVPDHNLIEKSSQLSSSCDLNQEAVPYHNVIEESSQLGNNNLNVSGNQESKTGDDDDDDDGRSSETNSAVKEPCNNLNPEGLSNDVIQETSNNDQETNLIPESLVFAIDATQESSNFIPEASNNDCVQTPINCIGETIINNDAADNSFVQDVFDSNDFIPEQPPPTNDDNIVVTQEEPDNVFLDDVFNTSFIQESSDNDEFIQESSSNPDNNFVDEVVFNSGDFIPEAPSNDYVTDTSNLLIQETCVQEVFNSNSFIPEASKNNVFVSNNFIKEAHNTLNDIIIQETANNSSYVHDVFNPSSNFVPQAFANDVISETYKNIESGVSDNNKMTSNMNFVPQEGTT